jgi:predicted amino acid-binding ACT domain protein
MQLFRQLLVVIGHDRVGLLQLFDVFGCLAQYGSLSRLNVSIDNDSFQ